MRAFRSLIYILCTFLFLKLPKILLKGKLFSFMLYLMKPNILLLLIKGGERIQRQMTRSWLFANLREITARQQSSFSRLRRQWNQSFLLFFSRFYFYFLFSTCRETKTNSYKEKIRGYCREKKPRQQYYSSYRKNGLSSQRKRNECMMLKISI